ncbi:MAG: hydroxymethylbilane synthase [Cyclobacteriaceae bacterium]|nr:hydroxymethylbilane synthase [Cyclobacteriaceae bacterium]
MELFKLVCRGSRLSLAQADIFKQKLLTLDPTFQVEITIKETKGDLNQAQPLTDLEGRDFFTKDIQDALQQGEADFAVHSMKDISGENFFKDNTYAVIEREVAHDVAIFNANVEEKIALGQPLQIGTSSPRRIEMAKQFLQNALPTSQQKRSILETRSIRGNVDTRLKKLDTGEYDGIILACAGLNRLLRIEQSPGELQSLLQKKKIMVLPLLYCPPAPGQGAIVVETTSNNNRAVEMLKRVNNLPLAAAVNEERKIAHQYGSGCHQKFGVVHIPLVEYEFTYAAGKDRLDQDFVEMTFERPATQQSFFSVEDATFFDAHSTWSIDVSSKNLFIDTVATPARLFLQQLKDKRIWVSETKNWFNLAKEGLWVEGSAEGFGIGFLNPVFNAPLIGINPVSFQIVTHSLAYYYWRIRGYQYTIIQEPVLIPSIEVLQKLAKADVVFWSGFWQYKALHSHLKKDVIHACATDGTQELFRDAGMKPLVFPCHQLFNEWKRKNTIVINGG